MRKKMETEEAVVNTPVLQERLTLFEERRHPSVSDTCIEGAKDVIDHPEDGLTTLGLTKKIAGCSVVHLFRSQSARLKPGQEEIEVFSTAGVNHRPRGQREIDLLLNLRRNGLKECFEGVPA